MNLKSKQTIKTGSGSFDIEVKGRDIQLIIPVIIIFGIVIIGAFVILFWK